MRSHGRATASVHHPLSDESRFSAVEPSSVGHLLVAIVVAGGGTQYLSRSRGKTLKGVECIIRSFVVKRSARSHSMLQLCVQSRPQFGIEELDRYGLTRDPRVGTP
jgi:hypothetical protein